MQPAVGCFDLWADIHWSGCSSLGKNNCETGLFREPTNIYSWSDDCFLAFNESIYDLHHTERYRYETALRKLMWYNCHLSQFNGCWWSGANLAPQEQTGWSNPVDYPLHRPVMWDIRLQGLKFTTATAFLETGSWCDTSSKQTFARLCFNGIKYCLFVCTSILYVAVHTQSCTCMLPVTWCHSSCALQYFDGLIQRRLHWPLLLTWFNFNPNMDKWLHPL